MSQTITNKIYYNVENNISDVSTMQKLKKTLLSLNLETYIASLNDQQIKTFDWKLHFLLTYANYPPVRSK